ncbi:uncharacterized protein BX664DRAFT_329894 [Halteromyces radiatus]|uniref:uncharacterized protein n=1 Tax=Halteromyces radiatus TaxID=101107 RepID=UPI00221F17DE|nr:uncharacterized protein BX664DRAFT_329894 [Halteromyces radiatus]KAI8093516.1 hypothetical protein BX664DRAFT_329894 [Halteromyces radiatus]
MNSSSHGDSSSRPSSESLPLRKSTRDWSKPVKTSVQDLSLISRTSHGANNTPSLKDVNLQIELWNDICKKTMEIKDPTDMKQWTMLVGLLRKLREGIWATRWSKGNYPFAIKVYEESVHTSLRAKEFGEYRKAIRGLVDDLYHLHKGINGHYLALDLIYQSCHLQQPQEAMQSLYLIEPSSITQKAEEIVYAKQVIHALTTHNWIQFFRLYQHPPHPAFSVVLEASIEPLRRYALKVMQKAYYSVPIPWVAHSLGLMQPSDHIIPLLHSIYPLRIDRIANDTIYFSKRK